MARITALAALAALAACAVANTYPATAPARAAAEGTPARFVNIPPQTASVPPDTFPGTGCLSPLYDFSDGTRLTLLASHSGVGDYAVPGGRYGVGPGEALRLECNTGRVIGIVPHRG